MKTYECLECGKTFQYDNESDRNNVCPECGSYNVDIYVDSPKWVQSNEEEE